MITANAEKPSRGGQRSKSDSSFRNEKFSFVVLITIWISSFKGYWFKNEIWGSLNKFPDFFHMGTFIDSTHIKP